MPGIRPRQNAAEFEVVVAVPEPANEVTTHLVVREGGAVQDHVFAEGGQGKDVDPEVVGGGESEGG